MDASHSTGDWTGRYRAGRLFTFVALALAMAAALALTWVTAAHAVVLRVGTYEGKAGQYTTIQEAVAAAKAGDWILIGPGDYKQATSSPILGGKGDDQAPADILVTTPNLHIRGMNRNTVMIDGTKPGSPQCSSAEADQNFGPAEGSSYLGNNGIVVYKASGVWLQNFSACNFLGANHGGDAIWFDGGGASGKQAIGSWWGEYLSSTSTYWAGKEPKPSARYGIYASNTYGPGIFENTYANNMADAGYYIGACPDCNTTLNHVRSEGNDLGYSGSNSGGHLLVENSEFNNNQEGFATTSQNNDDAPSPQDGICPKGENNPSPPAGAQRKNICWVLIHNRIVNNNNGATPTSAAAPGLVGTGMTIAGGHNDLVVENTFSGNNAWGIVLLPYPGIEEHPPEQVIKEFPEYECRGGTKAEVSGKHECLYEPFANEIVGNTFAKNGGYKNPSNGDIGEVANAEPKQLTNCWHGNVGEGGGEPTSEPKAIQSTHGTCSAPDAGGEPTTSVLAAQATCDSQLLAECPPVPGEEYPRSKEVKLLPLRQEPSMPDPCEGVPRNHWCNGLPEVGRCVTSATKTGEFKNGLCISEAAGRGRNNWLQGAGEKKQFTGSLGPVTLETVGNARVTCTSGSSSGEYTGAKTQTVTITLKGCQRPVGPDSCQSTGAASGEIVTSALEGKLGFIKGGEKPTVGWDLKHEPTLAAFECGAGKVLVTLEGSVIAPVKGGLIDKMTLESSLKYSAITGKQAPERFEGGVTDTLILTSTSGVEKTVEQAGLTSTETIKNEELLEIKARCEGVNC